jgi:hypothetical protein
MNNGHTLYWDCRKVRASWLALSFMNICLQRECEKYAAITYELYIKNLLDRLNHSTHANVLRCNM